uniref:t-SNARE coiled-coil homology domain-containing protein n=1 Tax=viral metagenome TaxID=1070528 RepID=A0A6C0EIR2_9ZZZZ
MQSKNDPVDESLKYKALLKDIKDLNDINRDLTQLMNTQNDQLNLIENLTDKTVETVKESNKELEIASKYNIKFKPIIIGGLIGASLLSPVSLLVGINTLYLMAGGGIAGSIVGKKLA